MDRLTDVLDGTGSKFRELTSTAICDTAKAVEVLLCLACGRGSAPIKDAAGSVDVYLPENSSWIDFRSGRPQSGGQTIQAEAPLSRSPLFVKTGSILPLGPRVQHSGEAPAAPLELRIYPGADASYLLYEDAGEGWGYQQGEFSVIPLSWDNKARRLKVGAIRGGFPGALKEREFHVVLVGPGQGTGVGPAAKPSIVRYNGRQVSLQLRQ